MIFRTNTLQVKEIEPGIVELLFHSSKSVNVLNVKTLKSLGKAIAVIKNFPSLRGLIIHSNKPSFIVGADINEFISLFHSTPLELRAWLSHVKSLFLEFENLPVPTVCTVPGYALGGGCELALTFDYRIATESTLIGLPETTLGIIPGFDGCVRLPRVVGVEAAVNCITLGKPLDAKSALSIGLVDEVYTGDELKLHSIDKLKELIKTPKRWKQTRIQKQKPISSIDFNNLNNYEEFLKNKVSTHFIAPYSALHLLKKSSSLPRDKASRYETNAFIELVKQPQAIAMVGNYLNEQYVKSMTKGKVNPPNSISIIGNSNIACELAIQTSSHHIDVEIIYPNSAALNHGENHIENLLRQAEAKSQIDQNKHSEIKSNISSSVDIRTISSHDFVIDTIIDKKEHKRTLLNKLSLSPSSVLLTSPLDTTITDLSEAFEFPQQMCGIHFGTPTCRMPYVEIIRGRYTSEETTQKALAFVSQIGKLAIRVSDTPGFFINRVLCVYLSELIGLINEHVDIERIDSVMEHAGWSIGPCTQIDIIGLDIIKFMLGDLGTHYPERINTHGHEVLNHHLSNNHHGIISGSGLYSYQSGLKQAPSILGKSESNISISDKEILDRLECCFINETIRCLDEGVISTPNEADSSLISTLGYPRHLGGVFRTLDNTGIEHYLSRIAPYQELSNSFHPPEGLLQRYEENITFYDLTNNDQHKKSST